MRRSYLLAAASVLTVAIIALLWWILNPLTSRSLVFSTGAKGGAYYAYAQEYLPEMHEARVKMSIMEGAGSVETIQRIISGTADAGFVQGGLGSSYAGSGIESLGAVFYEPVWILYRTDLAAENLSDLRGMRIGVGPEGSGTQLVALQLLAASDITDTNSTLVREPIADMLTAMQNGEMEAAIVVAAPTAESVQDFAHIPGVDVLDLHEAEAYAANYDWLEVGEIPAGLLDIAKSLPSSDKTVLMLAASLVVGSDVHPDLRRLLVMTAQKVHGGKGMLEEANQFPTTSYTDWPMDEAAYSLIVDGPQWYDRSLPFLLAGPIDRFVRFALPLFVLFTVFKAIDPLSKYWMNQQANRWYTQFSKVERDVGTMNAEEVKRSMEEVIGIRQKLLDMRLPTAYMPQVYTTRRAAEELIRQLSARAATLGEEEVVDMAEDEMRRVGPAAA